MVEGDVKAVDDCVITARRQPKEKRDFIIVRFV